MQKLKSVQLNSRLVSTEELEKVVPVTTELPDASEQLLGKSYFLGASGRFSSIVPTSSGTIRLPATFFLCGKIYECVSFTYIDQDTGNKWTGYKWEPVSFSENGKLKAIQDYSIDCVVNASNQGGGYTFRLTWEEQPDHLDPADPSNNAVWAYTVVVRKRGTSIPKTPFDGDVVGFSSVRNQYKGATSFYDYVPESNYSYNIFEVTRYGVATGIGDSGGGEQDWILLRDSIRSGTAGLSLGSTITVGNRFYGDIELQVVDIRKGDQSLIFEDGAASQNPERRSVVFMCRKCMQKTAYDVPELHEANGLINPGDSWTTQADIERYGASYHGRSKWAYSNLRLWLNQGSYIKVEPKEDPSLDVEIDPLKLYFIKQVNSANGNVKYVRWKYTGSSPTIEEQTEFNNYVQTGMMYESDMKASTDTYYNYKKVYFQLTFDDRGSIKYIDIQPDPASAGSVNPKNLGLYESPWRFVKQTIFDKKPEPFREDNPDAGYTVADGAKDAPGFLSGFPEDFQKAISKVKVITFNDRLTIGGSTVLSNMYEETEDYVFIPSYRELMGNEPLGIYGNDVYKPALNVVHEGSLFPFFNPNVEIEDMTLFDRSLIKEDANGRLSGYYTRTIDTAVNVSTQAWWSLSASGLWTISVAGHKTKPPLGQTGLPLVHRCNLSKAEAEEIDAEGIVNAPGIAWCVVIG